MKVDSLLSLAEAGRRIGRSREHMRRLVHKGALRVVTESGDWRIAESELARYVEAQKRRAAVRP